MRLASIHPHEFLRTAFALVVGWFAAAGCRTTELNAEHCGHRGGDAHCRSLDPDRPFCMVDEPRCHAGDGLGTRSGCVSSEVRDAVEPSCRWTCGARSPDDCMLTSGGASTSVEDDTESSSTSAPAQSSEGTTEPPTPGTCQDSRDCKTDDAPICAAERCVSCAAASADACGDRDPETPFCWGDECSVCDPITHAGCGHGLPFCDADTLRCRGCRHHVECGPGSLCLTQYEQGEYGDCSTGGYYVDPTALAGGDGSPEMPFASVSEAIAATDPKLPVVFLLRGGEYMDAVRFENRVIALSPAPDATSEIVFVGGYNTEPIFSLSDSASLHLDQIRIEATNMTPVFWARESYIRLNRSVLSHNEAGIAVLELGDFICENCIIANNGFSGARRPLFELYLAPIELVYTTVYDNRANEGVALHFDCNGFSDISVRNSIVISSQSYVPLESGTASSGGDEGSTGGSSASGSTDSGSMEPDAARRRSATSPLDATGDATSVGDETITGTAGDGSSDGSGSGSSSGGEPLFEVPPGESRSASCGFLARHSGIDGAHLVGEGSIQLHEPDDRWFVGAGGLNFKLSESGLRLFGELAQWSLGDPLVDFEGRPRAAREGAREAAGAVLP